MNFKAVLFDLDGTLLDTLEDIADSTNYVLEKNNLPTHPLQSYNKFVGDGLTMLMKRVLPKDKREGNLLDQCVEEFRREYQKRWNAKSKPYPGIKQMLDVLKGRKLKLAVLSNKPDDFTKQCVNELLPHWNFEMILGLNHSIPAKPNPTGAKKIIDYLKLLPEDILYVGDTDIDMKTASATGMYPCGVLWGFRSRKELEESGAKCLLEKPEDISALLD